MYGVPPPSKKYLFYGEIWSKYETFSEVCPWASLASK